MSRIIDAATADALDAPTINLVFIVSLDIQDDPILAWTGLGDLSFGASETGDAALDGKTFFGLTHTVAEIGTVADGKGGSAAVDLTLPGVDLTDDALRQVVYDTARWQFRTARLWFALLDDDGVVIGKPVRMKTGRMDQMPVSEDEEGMGTVVCRIESQQAYAGGPLATRYSEQDEIDPTDTSQKHVWALANMTAALGEANNIPGAGGASYIGGPYYGGGGGRREPWNSYVNHR